MASSVEQDGITNLLLKNVNCFLCLEKHDDPRLLECCHSFCLKCLEEYMETFDGKYIECPLCEGKTKRPRDAKDLKKNIYFQLHATSYGISCSICGEREFAKSHCIECNQDFCRMCIKSHGGITATREHHLVALDKKKATGKILRDIYCKIHTDDNLVYFCVECETLICKHCSLTAHKNHVSKHVSEVANDLRSRLGVNAESKEYKNYLMWLAERRERFLKETEKCKKLEREAVHAIKDRADKIRAVLTEIENILIRKANNITKKKMNPLKEKMKSFEKYIRSFSELLLHSRNLNKQADDLEIVHTSPRLIKMLDSLKQQNDCPYFIMGEFCIFKPGVVTADLLLPYFGDVFVGDDLYDNSSITVHEFLTERNDTILSLMPQKDQRVWVVNGGDGGLKLYDTSGRIHNHVRINIHVDDIFATDEHIIVSGNSSKMIKVFDKQFNELSSISTDLCCRGLAVNTDEKSIYTCLTEKNAFFDHDPTHNNKIVRIMPKGDRFDEIPDTLIFSGNPTVDYPARIAITRDGIVAVSDWKRNSITVLNKAGYIEKEYIYTADDSSTYKFCPRGICTNKYGDMYVADFTNSRILKLSAKDNKLKTALSEKDGIEKPWSVAYGENGILWVGSKSGKITGHYLKRPDHSLYKRE